MPVVDAMHRLRVHGLVEVEDYTDDRMFEAPPTLTQLTDSYEYREGLRQGVVEEFRQATSGPARVEDQIAVMKRWALADLGAKFAHCCDVQPLDVHGEFDGMVVRMDAAFFQML